MSLRLAHLATINPPYLHVLDAQLSDMRSELHRAVPGASHYELSGSSCTSVESLFRHWASVLRFPRYFGHNWAALQDCMTDLEWLPASGYCLVVSNSNQLLDNDPMVELTVLLDLLHETGEKWAEPVDLGEHWDRPAVPFHVVFQESGSAFREFRDKVRLAAAARQTPVDV